MTENEGSLLVSISLPAPLCTLLSVVLVTLICRQLPLHFGKHWEFQQQ